MVSMGRNYFDLVAAFGVYQSKQPPSNAQDNSTSKGFIASELQDHQHHHGTGTHYAPEAPIVSCCPTSLQFVSSPKLETKFEDEYASSRYMIDIVASNIYSILWITFLFKQQWDFTFIQNLCMMFLWFISGGPLVFLVLLKYRPTASHRTALIFMTRAGSIFLLLSFGSKDVLSYQSASVDYTRATLKLLFSSKSVALFMSTMGRQLLFKHHRVIAPLQLVAALHSNYGACAKCCQATDPGFATLVRFVLTMSKAFAAPAFAITGLPMSSLPLPTSGPAQCWLAFSFLSTVIGCLLPSAILYCMERNARRSFAIKEGYALPAEHVVGEEYHPPEACIMAGIAGVTAVWFALVCVASWMT